MKVYVVCSWMPYYDSDSIVEGVFATRLAAEAFCSKQEKTSTPATGRHWGWEEYDVQGLS